MLSETEEQKNKRLHWKAGRMFKQAWHSFVISMSGTCGGATAYGLFCWEEQKRCEVIFKTEEQKVWLMLLLLPLCRHSCGCSSLISRALVIFPAGARNFSPVRPQNMLRTLVRILSLMSTSFIDWWRLCLHKWHFVCLLAVSHNNELKMFAKIVKSEIKDYFCTLLSIFAWLIVCRIVLFVLQTVMVDVPVCWNINQ